MKPEGTYSGETFGVFTGDESRQPRVLAPGEAVAQADRALVVAVPVEHRQEFEGDILNALRDLAGVSTLAVHPFITDREAVDACLGTHPSLLSRDSVTWPGEEVRFRPDDFHRPELLRLAHLDLSLTGDATGLVVACVTGFERVARGGTTETLPRVRVDLALQVLPPRGGEVPFERVRAAVYALRDAGLPLRYVTADSYQSADTLQQLRRKDFITGTQSVDRDPRPYEVLRAAIRDGRLEAPAHEVLRGELLGLERDARTGKVDHRPHGSKDVADALAGAVYGLARLRDVWAQHGVRPFEAAPEFVRMLRTPAGEDRDAA